MGVKLRRRLKLFIRDEQGSTAMMFAVSIIFILAASGLAIDGSVLRSEKMKLQASADAGVLAGAISAHKLSESKRQRLAQGAFYGNSANYGHESIIDEVKFNFDDSSQTVSVVVKASPRLYLMGLFSGKKSSTITVKSEAAYKSVDRRPIAISMVLDVSGSMGWNSTDGTPKIDSLKSATQSLFVSVEDAIVDLGPINTYLRTSVTTYNSSLVGSTPLVPGYVTTQTAIDALTAGGGTNSEPALRAGLNVLINNPNRVGQSYREYLVFMTDGDNNDPASDPLSADICQSARENDITVYSVAFESPEKGQQLLLRCASAPSDPARSEAPTTGNNGNAYGHTRGKGPFPISPGRDKCRGDANGNISDECRTQKDQYYIEANSALSFETAFEGIGKSIGNEAIRLK